MRNMLVPCPQPLMHLVLFKKEFLYDILDIYIYIHTFTASPQVSESFITSKNVNPVFCSNICQATQKLACFNSRSLHHSRYPYPNGSPATWTHLTSMKEAFSLAEKAQLAKPDALAITRGWSSACLGKKMPRPRPLCQVEEKKQGPGIAVSCLTRKCCC